MFQTEWQVCPLGLNFKQDSGGQHWVTPLQIRPTAATDIQTSKPSKPTAQSLSSVYAHAPSHAELSLSAQQQALFTQLLSDGSTLMKGHRTASTYSKPVS